MGSKNVIALRRERGDLQTAAFRFIRPHDGRTITLIAVIHIGEIEYYTALRELIDEQVATGSQVQVEGLPVVATPEMSTEQRFALERMRDDLNWMRIIDTLNMDLVHQWAGLRPEPSWVCADVNVLEIVDRFGSVSYDILVPTGMKVARLVLSRVDSIANDPKKREFYAECIRDSILAQGTRWARVFHRFLAWRNESIHWRSDCGARRAIEHDSDVVSIWGALHVPRMAAEVLDAGFRLESTEWFTVLHKPERARKVKKAKEYGRK